MSKRRDASGYKTRKNRRGEVEWRRDEAQLCRRRDKGCALRPVVQRFRPLDLAYENGWTVAHVAAAYGHVPVGFDHWDLAYENGWTVAHVAAAYGHLPAGFDHWDWADNDGFTIARVAAAYGGSGSELTH